MKTELLDSLLLAIGAMNATPSFDTGVPDPDHPRRTLSSYKLTPRLEAAAREQQTAPDVNRELLDALEFIAGHEFLARTNYGPDALQSLKNRNSSLDVIERRARAAITKLGGRS